ncbi:MAG: hypothetical protein KGH78_01170 [Candidatus Micrarchaeota archaeon]|nr:hypothetical protein [Candidatus Micrarchaeota archaeon]
MKIQKNMGVTVFVATLDQGDKCPRVLIKGAKSTFRDDYSGSVSIKKGIAAKLFGRI